MVGANARLDGLPKTDFVGKELRCAKMESGTQRVCFNLMGIEVNLSVGQGQRETIDRRRTGALCQFVRKISGMIKRQFYIPHPVQKHNDLYPLLRLQNRGTICISPSNQRIHALTMTISVAGQAHQDFG
jgi:hypothetical protein